MTQEPISPEPEQLIHLSEHLAYEIQMLLGSAMRLAEAANRPVEPVVANALVESFAMHLRVLIDFFWKDSSRVEDDALAVHFFPPGRWVELRPEKPPVFDAAWIKAGRTLAHLSYQRLGIAGDEKGWQLQLALEMMPVIRTFTETVAPEFVDAKFEQELRPLLTALE